MSHKLNWVQRADGTYELHNWLGEGADRRVFLFSKEEKRLFVRSVKRKGDIIRIKKERGEYVYVQYTAAREGGAA
jgi:hypothetical protein